MEIGEDDRKHMMILVDGGKCRTRRTEVNVRADEGDSVGGRKDGPMVKGE